MREGIASGELRVGNATTTMFFPVLLPYDCCRGLAPSRKGSRIERCARCDKTGWTHGQHARQDYRCVDCQEYVGAEALAALRQP